MNPCQKGGLGGVWIQKMADKVGIERGQLESISYLCKALFRSRSGSNNEKPSSFNDR
jgi:hypothetical protein